MEKNLIAKKMLVALIVAALLLIYHILGPVDKSSFTNRFYILIAALPFITLIISELIVCTINTVIKIELFGNKILTNIILFTITNAGLLCTIVFAILKYILQQDSIECAYSMGVILFIHIMLYNVWALKVKNDNLKEEIKFTENSIEKHKKTKLLLYERVEEIERTSNQDVSIPETSTVIVENTTIAKPEIAEDTTSEAEPEEEQDIVLTGTTKDTLTVKPSDIVYAKSESNYVYICYINEKGKYANTMLRAKIQAIEEQLKDCPKIVRCHRSYIVNLKHVTGRESRPNGLMLIIDTGKERVPVSRSYDKGMRDIVKSNNRLMALIIVLTIITGTICALPVIRQGVVDSNHKRYIDFMHEIEILEKKNESMKAMYAAHALMEESKRKNDKVGIFAASCKMYQLYTERRNGKMSKAYADTMKMFMPDESYRKYIDNIVINTDNLEFATTKKELEIIRRIEALCQEEKYKEAYELEKQIEDMAMKQQTILAGEDYNELSMAKANDSLTQVSARQKLKIAQALVEQSREEAEKAKLEAEKAKAMAEKKKTELKKAQLEASAKTLADKIDLEKERNNTERIKQEAQYAEKQRAFIIALCAVSVIGLLFILYEIFTYRKNMKELNHIIETILGMFIGALMIYIPTIVG